jgi:hypothetical protein
MRNIYIIYIDIFVLPRVAGAKKQVFFHVMQVINCCRLDVDLQPGSRVTFLRRSPGSGPQIGQDAGSNSKEDKPEASFVFVDISSEKGEVPYCTVSSSSRK